LIIHNREIAREEAEVVDVALAATVGDVVVDEVGLVIEGVEEGAEALVIAGVVEGEEALVIVEGEEGAEEVVVTVVSVAEELPGAEGKGRQPSRARKLLSRAPFASFVLTPPVCVMSIKRSPSLCSITRFILHFCFP